MPGNLLRIRAWITMQMQPWRTWTVFSRGGSLTQRLVQSGPARLMDTVANIAEFPRTMNVP